MKINRYSKWYKFISFTWYVDPLTVCTLFWKSIFTLFEYLIGMVAAALFVLGAVYTAAIVWWNPIANDVLHRLLLAVGVVCWAAIIIIAIGSIMSFIVSWNRERRYRKIIELEEAGQEYQPSLVYQYYRAIKDKVCPLVEYESKKTS